MVVSYLDLVNYNSSCFVFLQTNNPMAESVRTGFEYIGGFVPLIIVIKNLRFHDLFL